MVGFEFVLMPVSIRPKNDARVKEEVVRNVLDTEISRDTGQQSHSTGYAPNADNEAATCNVGLPWLRLHGT